jgi:hypothetical protein
MPALTSVPSIDPIFAECCESEGSVVDLGRMWGT